MTKKLRNLEQSLNILGAKLLSSTSVWRCWSKVVVTSSGMTMRTLRGTLRWRRHHALKECRQTVTSWRQLCDVLQQRIKSSELSEIIPESLEMRKTTIYCANEYLSNVAYTDGNKLTCSVLSSRGATQRKCDTSTASIVRLVIHKWGINNFRYQSKSKARMRLRVCE